MKHQKLRYISIGALTAQADKAKVNFERFIIHTTSERLTDKNGDSYRTFRGVDFSTKAITVKIWGNIAADDELFQKDNVLCIHQCTLNKKDRRIDIRDFSSLRLLGEATEVPNKLSYVTL